MAKATHKPSLIKAQPQAEPAPEWLDNTPNETQYCLQVDHESAAHSPIEVVEVTRAEYVMLKRVLAVHRGYEFPEVEANAA